MERCDTLPLMPLTLYRRHRKNCKKKYLQNVRVFQPTNKSQRAGDCECPINAEGTLELAGYITNRSTKKTAWDGSRRRCARQWEEWGQLTQPATAESNEFVTVQYAVESFLTSQGPRGRNVEPRTFNTFAVLLNQRLLPYCAANGYM